MEALNRQLPRNRFGFGYSIFYAVMACLATGIFSANGLYAIAIPFAGFAILLLLAALKDWRARPKGPAASSFTE